MNRQRNNLSTGVSVFDAALIRLLVVGATGANYDRELKTARTLAAMVEGKPLMRYGDDNSRFPSAPGKEPTTCPKKEKPRLRRGFLKVHKS